jgi:DNA-binding response OmpR family regulator
MNILLVEDERALRDPIAAALAMSGHQVVGAEHGLEALERVRERLPDLIVLDLQLPEMDGWEFLRHFRSQPAAGAVPVVVMSAAHRVAVDKLGAQAFFAKPFDLDELIDTIDGLLAAAHVRANGRARVRTRSERAYAPD